MNKNRSILKNIVYIYILCNVLFLCTPNSILAANAIYIQSWALYDANMHIDYKNNNSSYYSYIRTGATTWNTYKSGVLRQDTSSTIADVTISDVNWNSNYMAMTYVTGSIKFNISNMTTATESQRKNVATHELGHALGVNHVPQSTDLMYDHCNDTYTLSTIDKNSYTAAYNFFMNYEGDY